MDKTNSKFCKKCHTLKPFSDFSKSKRYSTGLETCCRACIKIKNDKVYSEKIFGQQIEAEIEAEILKEYSLNKK